MNRSKLNPSLQLRLTTVRYRTNTKGIGDVFFTVIVQLSVSNLHIRERTKSTRVENKEKQGGNANLVVVCHKTTGG